MDKWERMLQQVKEQETDLERARRKRQAQGRKFGLMVKDLLEGIKTDSTHSGRLFKVKVK